MTLVRFVAFLPNGKHIISGLDNNTIQLWDAIIGVALETLKGYSSLVYSVAFSPNGKAEPGLIVSNDWVMEGKEKILWLPLEYRVTCEAV